MSKRGTYTARNAPRCQQCDGTTGGDWIPYRGIRWAVRDVSRGADGEFSCSWCREHPGADVQAASYHTLTHERTL